MRKRNNLGKARFLAHAYYVTGCLKREKNVWHWEYKLTTNCLSQANTTDSKVPLLLFCALHSFYCTHLFNIYGACMEVRGSPRFGFIQEAEGRNVCEPELGIRGINQLQVRNPDKSPVRNLGPSSVVQPGLSQLLYLQMSSCLFNVQTICAPWGPYLMLSR